MANKPARRDKEARRTYMRAYMAKRRASTGGEAAARKKEPVAAHPQKSNRAIAATGVALKIVPAGQASNDLRRRSALMASPISMAGLKSASRTTGPHAITK